MKYLTETHRIEILMMIGYGDNCRSQVEVANLFNHRYPELPNISQSTVSKIHAQFRELGHVKPLKRKPHFVEDDVKVDILLSVEENPTSSTRQIARENNVSQTTVLRCLHKEKLHPYKLTFVQELTEDDPDRRMDFCERLMNKLNRNEIALGTILFSDESTFTLNGEVNRQNCRYWSAENPNWMRETHTQYPQKVNVWAGIIGDHIIGPIFIDGNLTAEKYLNMLRNEVIPALANLYPNAIDPSLPNGNVWFQQDGATPHYALMVRTYLDEIFPNKWIGRRGTIEWPARSPDLTPLDFYLWGYLKNKVYATQPTSIVDLKDRMTTEIRNISPQTLNKVKEEFYRRLCYCQQLGGEHFEHLF